MRLCQILCISFAILVLGIFSPRQVFAETKVVINEFLVDPQESQWVELYNAGTETVDISGWFIDDGGSPSEKFTIPDDTQLRQGDFAVFESSYFNFNKSSADKVQLIQGADVRDSYSYNLSPGVNNSFGRENDGKENWVAFSSLTKGSSNNTALRLPTATATPMPTVKPTATPKVPTSTTAPTPTKTLTPTKGSSTTTEKTKTDESDSFADKKIDEFEEIDLSGVPTAILGIGTKAAEKKASSATAKNKKNNTVLVKDFSGSANQGFPFHIVFLSLGGVLLIGCAILIYLKNRRQHHE